MSISIILDNKNQNVWFPGQTIAGRVECNFNKEKKLRAIRITFVGCAEVEWQEHEPHFNRPVGVSQHNNLMGRTHHNNLIGGTHHNNFPGTAQHNRNAHSQWVRYYGREEYFNAEYVLLQGGDDFSLSAGQHVYPFSYILPPQLPSSFKGSNGKVEYYIKAVIDRPWKFDHESIFPLNVTSPLDLNYIPGLRDPVALSDEKTMCSCWCNDSGALTFNVSLAITGYAAGQPINIAASIKNMTNVSVEQVKFEVFENVEFISQYPRIHHRFSEDKVAECVADGIGAHGENSWTSSLIIPPHRVYPNMIPCNIINVIYRLIAKAVIPFPHANLELEFPIHIGHVPLGGVNTFVPAHPSTSPPTVYDPLLPPPGAEGFDSKVHPYPENGGGAYPPPPGASYLPPPIGGSPYPVSEKQGPYPLPAGGAYPPSQGTFFPPSTGTAYPPPGTTYTPSEKGGPYPPPTGAPYPPSVSVPYPPPTGAPYPPGPSAPSAGVPYPPQSEKAPSGWMSEPSKDTSASAPPPAYGDISPEKKEKM